MFNSLTTAQLVATYNGFATQLGTKPVKRFETRVSALARTEALAAEALKKFPVPVVAKPVVAKPAKADKPVSAAARIKSLIADGLDNKAVWAIVQPKFNMPDSKKNYPAWYRREMNLKAK